MYKLYDEFTTISKSMCKTVTCKHSLPSQSHHLPQPETISALAAAIMRSSWKSNKGLQGEQLYTSIIPLGCYGMFFHQTTVCQALVQMEKALTCLWSTYNSFQQVKDKSDDNFEQFFFLPATVVNIWPLYCIAYYKLAIPEWVTVLALTHFLALPYKTQQ